MNDKVTPLKSIEIELKQIQQFYKDIIELDKSITDKDYEEQLVELRDKTDSLRADFSVMYTILCTEADNQCDNCKHLQVYQYDREVDIDCVKGHTPQVYPPMINCKDYEEL